MRIGLIVAMEKELAQLLTLLSHEQRERHHGMDFFVGDVDGREVVLRQCGIGKVNSAVGAVEMIDNYQPDLILSTGVAGGADTVLNPLDVVVGTACAYHDAYCGDNAEPGQIIGLPARFEAPRQLVDKALALQPLFKGIAIRAGLTVSGEWFVDTKEKMADILKRFPEAEAVDMESCSIAQTCFLYQVPFLSFRIISDVPLKDHKAAQYFDFWDRMAEGSFEVTRAFLKAL